MGFAHENDYDALIAHESAAQGVPFAFIKGIIAAESQFVPSAYRAEQGDASRGLMQVLLSTARALGYTGSSAGLYDPATNIHYGVKLLHGILARTGGNVASAASAYNGGFRPSLGFGSPATAPVTVCLARDTAGKCTRTFTAQPGQYGNQPYVDTVLRFTAQYGGADLAPPVITLTAPTVVSIPGAGTVGPSTVAVPVPGAAPSGGSLVSKLGGASVVASALTAFLYWLVRRWTHG